MSNFYIDEYDEISPRKQKRSFVKNQVEEVTITDELKNELLNAKVDHRYILGYRTKDGLSVKYNKENELFIVFNENNKIIVCELMSWRDYNSHLYDATYKYCYENELY